MIQDIPEEDFLFLAGYFTAFCNGFAMPCYRSGENSNVWYEAVTTIGGDHDGLIESFDIIEIDEISPLPRNQWVRVEIGDPWVDVFLANGEPLVGRPKSIAHSLRGELDNLAKLAPVSLADLMIAANDKSKDRVLDIAFRYVFSSHGQSVADKWLRNEVLSERVKLICRRIVHSRGIDFSDACWINEIYVRKEAGRFRVQFPRSARDITDNRDVREELEVGINTISPLVELSAQVYRESDDGGSAPGHEKNELEGFSNDSEDQIAEYRAAAATSAELAEKMLVLARTDVVTGLANRAGLNHAMVEALMADEGLAQHGLFWIDLDRFKEVNDMLGHVVGDRVLAEVARRLKATFPSNSTVSRFGGDEFITFGPIKNRRHAERLASEVHEVISQPFVIDGQRLDVRASLGVALLPADGSDADTLMQCADLALYHAKAGGRAQTRFFDKSMTRDLAERREIEEDLRVALERNELSAFFQPIVDLETGKIKSFEALMRWFHPEKGELRPDQFIPVAEETGLIMGLGEWILEESVRVASQWPDDICVAVNLSPLQLRGGSAASTVRSVLERYSLSPDRLELEVTESVFIEESQFTQAFMNELSDLGVKFALDDFGTGFSSLGYISAFPFSKIKIDRSFVSGPNVGRRSDAIIRAIAELGVSLDMQIVAEGLETVEQVSAVRDAGCTLGQGFYFSRAVPSYLADMLIAQEGEAQDAASDRIEKEAS